MRAIETGSCTKAVKEGYQRTWMDAKVDNWVVTPRRGKAVEINALYYNALKLLEGWSRESGQHERADKLAADALKLRMAFNQRFWFAEGGYLYDVVDANGGGDDSACRPNQVFAIALDHPAVLDEARWPAVMEVVRTRLLTPVGLRSLAPGSADYKARYFGDLAALARWGLSSRHGVGLAAGADGRCVAQAASRGRCHRARLVEWLRIAHLSEAGVGTVSEIFDAEAPYTPRGCIAASVERGRAVALHASSIPSKVKRRVKTESRGEGHELWICGRAKRISVGRMHRRRWRRQLRDLFRARDWRDTLFVRRRGSRNAFSSERSHRVRVAWARARNLVRPTLRLSRRRPV